MPVTSVLKDADTLTLTVHAEFPVPVERLWQAYLDPRQIEKFWGPPGYPATFTRHDGCANGFSHYYMTSPEGETFHGYWQWSGLLEHRLFEVIDGFATAEGEPNRQLPTTRVSFAFSPWEEGSKLTVTSHFNSVEDLEQLLEMGMDEGLRLAMGQLDQVLVDLGDVTLARPTEAQLLSDTKVRISRVIRGNREQVWHAYHDPQMLRRWMFGPDGWGLTECVVGSEVGQEHRSWWEPQAGSGQEGFGFCGRILARQAPVYERTTEQMIGTDSPVTVNELTLTPAPGGTLLTLVITYPDAHTRDSILGTGMTDGMEASYARLDSLL